MTIGKLTSQIPEFTIYSANILLQGIMWIFQFLLTHLLIKETRSRSKNSDILDGFRKFPALLITASEYGLKNKTIFLLLITTLAWGIVFSGLEMLWQPQVKSIGNIESQTWIFGLLATGYFLADSLGNMIMIRISNLYQGQYSIILFFNRIIMAFIFLLLALQKGLIGFSCFYWTLFIFEGISSSPPPCTV